MMVLPYVIVNVASSLDGIIGLTGSSLILSNQEDWQRVHNLRSSVNAIIVGANTVINDNPLLTIREVQSPSVHPFRVVLDSSFRCPLDAQIFHDQQSYPTIVFTSSSAPKDKIVKARNNGVSVEFVDVTPRGLDLKQILSILDANYSVRRVLVEGGARIISSFLLEGLVNELFLYYAPTFVGHHESTVPLFVGSNKHKHFSNKFDLPNLKIHCVKKLSEGALLHFVGDKGDNDL